MCCHLFLEVCGPGELHQQPHEQSRSDSEGSMIEKANRDKAKDEWVGRAPEPKILVQDVKHDNCEYQQDLFHDVSAKPFWQKQSRTNRRLVPGQFFHLRKLLRKKLLPALRVEAQIAA
jgi:hypothetical protein